MNEAQITKKAVAACRKRGAMTVKIHGGPHQPAGLPDIVGCFHGHFFGIEMKAPGKESNLTERQQKKLRDIEKAGGTTSVCTSVGEVMDVLDVIEASHGD